MSSTFMTAFAFALSIIVPNMLLMAMGFWLKKRSEVNDEFILIASNIIFKYCLPCLLFFSVIKNNIALHEQWSLLLAGVVTTFIVYFLAEIYAYFFVKDIADKGVFVQGTFRSNMAIIGLACVANAYGHDGIGVGAIFMGVITILYNILSVITLSRTQAQSQSALAKAKDMLCKIAANPLIIALVAGFTYQALGLEIIPDSVEKTGHLLAAVALPLALLCAGASIDLRKMFGLSGVSMQASIGRIVVAPLVAILVGLLFKLPALQFGVMFILVSAPTAAASYVMARSMGGNATLAANILGFTTIFSMLGMGIGVMILRTLAWI